MIADENHLCLELRLYDASFQKKVAIGMYENVPTSELGQIEGKDFQVIRDIRRACNTLVKELELELKLALQGRNDEQSHLSSH